MLSRYRLSVHSIHVEKPAETLRLVCLRARLRVTMICLRTNPFRVALANEDDDNVDDASCGMNHRPYAAQRDRRIVENIRIYPATNIETCARSP